MTSAIKGVSINQVGPKYDAAIGYDDGEKVEMMGYVMQAGTTWSEADNLQDRQELIATSSPNQIDRYLTNWPKVSQGDWSLGERQVTFIDPRRYYITDGAIDVTKPSGLQLINSPTITTYTTNGTYNLTPTASDGGSCFIGLKSGSNNYLQILNGGSPTAYSIAGGTEFYDFLYYPNGLICGNAGGIWGVTAGPPPVATNLTTDAISWVPCRSLAYFNNLIYYITGSITTKNNLIKAYDPTVPSSSTFITAGTYEKSFSGICSSPTGIIYTTSSPGSPAVTTVWSWDGNTSSVPGTRIADFRGMPFGMAEVGGVVYIAAWSYQIGQFPYVLYAISGNNVQPLDDTRYLLSDFQATPVAYEVDANGIPIAKAGITGDGRFLYVSWPGYACVRYDIVNSGVSHIGTGAGGAGHTVDAHRMEVYTSDTFDQVAAYGSSVELRRYNSAPTTGKITLSYFDFDTPEVVKSFKSLQVGLAQPLPSGASITVEYQVDGINSFSTIPTTQMQTLNNGDLLFVTPGVKGGRIQYRVTLTAGSSTSPVIRSFTAKATLARVWKATFQCDYKQQTNDGGEDDQGHSATELLANIANISQNNAGVCIAYVPSDLSDTGVEQVTCELETYSKEIVKPGKLNADEPTGLYGTVQVTLKEIV